MKPRIVVLNKCSSQLKNIRLHQNLG